MNKKIKLIIDCDERYPDYSFTVPNNYSYSEPVEVDEGIFKKWKKALNQYEDMQLELEVLYAKPKKK